jgi:hypothetical protein
MSPPPTHPQIANYRKEIAELLRTGKQDYARIRVEVCSGALPLDCPGANLRLLLAATVCCRPQLFVVEATHPTCVYTHNPRP